MEAIISTLASWVVATSFRVSQELMERAASFLLLPLCHFLSLLRQYLVVPAGMAGRAVADAAWYMSQLLCLCSCWASAGLFLYAVFYSYLVPDAGGWLLHPFLPSSSTASSLFSPPRTCMASSISFPLHFTTHDASPLDLLGFPLQIPSQSPPIDDPNAVLPTAFLDLTRGPQAQWLEGIHAHTQPASQRRGVAAAAKRRTKVIPLCAGGEYHVEISLRLKEMMSSSTASSSASFSPSVTAHVDLLTGVDGDIEVKTPWWDEDSLSAPPLSIPAGNGSALLTKRGARGRNHPSPTSTRDAAARETLRRQPGVAAGIAHTSLARCSVPFLHPRMPRSRIFRWSSAFLRLPLWLLGLVEEEDGTREEHIVCFQGFRESSYHPTTAIRVYLSSPHIAVAGGDVVIRRALRGLPAFFTSHPLLACLLLVSFVTSMGTMSTCAALFCAKNARRRRSGLPWSFDIGVPPPWREEEAVVVEEAGEEAGEEVPSPPAPPGEGARGGEPRPTTITLASQRKQRAPVVSETAASEEVSTSPPPPAVLDSVLAALVEAGEALAASDEGRDREREEAGGVVAPPPVPTALALRAERDEYEGRVELSAFATPAALSPREERTEEEEGEERQPGMGEGGRSRFSSGAALRRRQAQSSVAPPM